MTAELQSQKEEENKTCREPQGTLRKDELIGGKPPVVK
jgi:hypothetical protein